MATSNPVSLQLCMLLVSGLVPLAVSYSTASRQTKNANVIEMETSGVRMDADTLQLHLPQLLPLAIGYRFASVWGVRTIHERFCSKEDSDKIMKCHIARLYDAIDHRHNSRGKSTANGIDFNKALDKLCSYYNKYTQCLQEFEVRNCFLDERVIVDVLYSYMCSDNARKDLSTFDAGRCLSALSVSSVMKTVRKNPTCSNIFYDISSSLQLMFSQYYLHPSDVTKEIPAMKTSLSILCRNWYLQEKCLLPVYGERCGDSAKSLYIGLLNHMKKALVDKYKRYGVDISKLVLCGMSTGKNLTNQPWNNRPTNALRNYLFKQYKIWQSGYDYCYINGGTCDSCLTYNRLLMCFWKTMYYAGNNVVAIISNVASSTQEILHLFEEFSQCCDDYVKDCPPDSKVSFEYVLQSIRDIANNTENVKDCIGAISLLHISGEKCGMTLSEIVNYYLFVGSKLYDRSAALRGSNLPMQDSLGDMISCVKKSAEDVSSSGDNSVCSHNVISQVRSLIDSLQGIIHQYDNFIKHF